MTSAALLLNSFLYLIVVINIAAFLLKHKFDFSPSLPIGSVGEFCGLKIFGWNG